VTIEWSPNAKAQLREVLTAIAYAQYPEDAARWLNSIQERTNILADFPESGRISPVQELATRGIREITYKRYRVFYTIDDETCRIISFRHGAMNIKPPSDL